MTLGEVLHGEPVTPITMDIECGEPKAIADADGFIVDVTPVLAIYRYHRQEYFFTTRNKLRDMVGYYQIFIHRYGYQFSDVVCIAVSPECAAYGVGEAHV